MTAKLEGMSPDQIREWLGKQAKHSVPLIFSGPDITGESYMLVVGQSDRILGATAVVKMNRLQAFNMATNILLGFQREAMTAGSAEFVNLRKNTMLDQSTSGRSGETAS